MVQALTGAPPVACGTGTDRSTRGSRRRWGARSRRAREPQVERLRVGTDQLGHIERTVCTLASRYSGDCTILAYRPGSRCSRRRARSPRRGRRAVDAVGVRVERADHVVAIDPEVEREMVPRAGGHHDVRDVVALGSAATRAWNRRRRPCRSRPRRGRSPARPVPAGRHPGEHDRLDPPCGTRAEVELLGLAAARLRVHQQHGVSRAHGAGAAPTRTAHRAPPRRFFAGRPLPQPTEDRGDGGDPEDPRPKLPSHRPRAWRRRSRAPTTISGQGRHADQAAVRQGVPRTRRSRS